MAVFRVEKTRDYTVMANHHLRNKALSLKAKGLLSLMLSLPEDWDYTLKGLSLISIERIDAIREGIRELERAGYIVRSRERNAKGQLKGSDYVIYELPQGGNAPPISEKPTLENPTLDNPILDKPILGMPTQENPTQLNTNRSKTNPFNTLSQNPYPIKSYPINPAEAGMDARLGGTRLAGLGLRAVENGKDAMDEYREIVKENIEYSVMRDNFPYDHERLDEIVELMAETLCSQKATICIAGDNYPAASVKMKLLRINSLHIQYVFECLDKNTSEIRNIKKYLLAVLFNAPSTMGSYYKAQVNHDMYGG